MGRDVFAFAEDKYISFIRTDLKEVPVHGQQNQLAPGAAGGAVRRTTLIGAAVWHGLTEGLSTLCISMPTWLRIFRECPQ